MECSTEPDNIKMDMDLSSLFQFLAAVASSLKIYEFLSERLF
jgi:hypothetical protein